MSIITNSSLLKKACEKTLDPESDRDSRLKVVEEIKSKMLEELNSNSSLLGLAAPQIGINKRVIALKFADNTIKFYIDPIITKKEKYLTIPETFSSLPGKEILILRPTEIRLVYTTDDLKYEDNKMIDNAAVLFDQLYNLLDGITPDEYGLVSDPSTDGSLSDLSTEDFNELVEVYKKYVSTKLDGFNEVISSDEELNKSYTQLKFAEKVLHGEASLVDQEGWEIEKQYKKAQLKKRNARNAKTFREFVGSRKR